jgi:tight adherence protein C
MFALLLGFVCLTAAIYFLADVVSVPLREREGSIRRAASYGRPAGPALGPGGDESLRERALQPLYEKIARTVLRLSPKSSFEGVSFKLLQAGASRRMSPMTFLAMKGMATIGGGVLGLILGSSKSASSALLFCLALGAMGFIIPEFVLSKRIKSRQETIRAQLPDAIDLLAVSVEAGLGFDGAVAKLTEQMGGPLADEFALTLNEMRVGESRPDALKKLVERVPVPELSNFVRSIIQSDQFGISLGRILKLQAADTRLRRQLAAEEKAMKAPIKMLFPTVFFIFPTMFIVILGPAMLNLGDTF